MENNEASMTSLDTELSNIYGKLLYYKVFIALPHK